MPLANSSLEVKTFLTDTWHDLLTKGVSSKTQLGFHRYLAMVDFNSAAFFQRLFAQTALQSPEALLPFDLRTGRVYAPDPSRYPEVAELLPRCGGALEIYGPNARRCNTLENPSPTAVAEACMQHLRTYVLDAGWKRVPEGFLIESDTLTQPECGARIGFAAPRLNHMQSEIVRRYLGFLFQHKTTWEDHIRASWPSSALPRDERFGRTIGIQKNVYCDDNQQQIILVMAPHLEAILREEAGFVLPLE